MYPTLCRDVHWTSRQRGRTPSSHCISDPAKDLQSDCLNSADSMYIVEKENTVETDEIENKKEKIGIDRTRSPIKQRTNAKFIPDYYARVGRPIQARQVAHEFVKMSKRLKAKRHRTSQAHSRRQPRQGNRSTILLTQNVRGLPQTKQSVGAWFTAFRTIVHIKHQQ